MSKYPFKFKKEHAHNWNQLGPPALIVHNYYPIVWEEYCALFQCLECDERQYRRIQDMTEYNSVGYAITDYMYRLKYSHLWGEVLDNPIKVTISVSSDIIPFLDSNRVGFNGF